jgi:hypothetical protein
MIIVMRIVVGHVNLNLGQIFTLKSMGATVIVFLGG